MNIFISFSRSFLKMGLSFHLSCWSIATVLIFFNLIQCNNSSNSTLVDFLRDLQRKYRDGVYSLPNHMKLREIGKEFYNAFISDYYVNYTQGLPVLLFSRQLHSDSSFGNNVGYYFEVNIFYLLLL